MDFWLAWVSLGLLLIIVELFLGTFDFLALGFAAILAGLLSLGFWIGQEIWYYSVIIFVVAGALAIYISRSFLVPHFKKTHEKNPMSMDSIVGQQLIVQMQEKTKVVYSQGLYRRIRNDDSVNPWDTVEVVSIKENRLEVKKIM